jgi:hypothetical protein
MDVKELAKQNADHVRTRTSKSGVAWFTDGFCTYHVRGRIYSLHQNGVKVLSGTPECIGERLAKLDVRPNGPDPQ